MYILHTYISYIYNSKKTFKTHIIYFSGIEKSHCISYHSKLLILKYMLTVKSCKDRNFL